MKKLALIPLLSLCFCFSFAVNLQHISPQTYAFGTEVQLMAEIVSGGENVSEIKVFYHDVGDPLWRFQPVKQESKGSIYYRVTLSAMAITTEPIEYYFEVSLNNGNKEYFPAQDGLTPKFSILPAAMEGDLSPGFVLLNDEKSVSADDGYLLAVSYFAIMDDIDPASIEVWVNGRNVTSQSLIAAPTILYRLAKPVAGIKKAVIKAKLGTKTIHSDTWKKEILPSTKGFSMPFDYQGSVNFASNVYGYSKEGSTPGATNSDFATWADVYGTYGIARFQTNLYLSSLEKANQQPVDRYTLGVQIPHFELYAGDYAPTLSQFTLNNKNIRGLYSRVFGRYISLSWAHGQSVRKTTSEEDVSTAPGIQKSGTFKQEAIGARLQLGSEQETAIGINISRHRDLISSLDREYYVSVIENESPSPADTIYTTQARDNAVISTDIRVNLTDQNVIAGAEIASSLLNKNTIPGPMTQSEIESYSGSNVFIDPADFSDIFVFNKNMEPFIPGKASMAWLVYLRTYFWNNFINVQYNETGSAFNALGASYQMNDSRSVNVTDQLHYARILVLSGGLTYTADNLMGHKSETNKYTTWNLQSILRFPDLPYLKLGYYNNEGENEDNLDIESTTPFESYLRNSHNFNIGIGYLINQMPYAPTQMDISFRTGADDMTKSSIIQTDNKNSGFNYTMVNRFTDLPLNTQLSFSLNSQKQNLLDIKNRNQSVFIGADYLLWNKRIKPHVNYRFVNLGGDQGKQNYGFLTLGAEANPLKDTTVSSDIEIQSHSNKDNSSSGYSTITWRMLLSQKF